MSDINSVQQASVRRAYADIAAAHRRHNAEYAASAEAAIARPVSIQTDCGAYNVAIAITAYNTAWRALVNECPHHEQSQ